MTILVTGANGQLGRSVRCRVGEGEHKFLFTDVEELDITRREELMNYVLHNGVGMIINCAAYTNVDGAEDAEETAELINGKAVGLLADAMKAVGGILIHISTDYVFGGSLYNTPCAEDAECNPTGAYGRTKLAGERAVLNSGCHYIILRTGWLYSEFGNNFVKTMLRVLQPDSVRNVVFDQVGTPTYAGDLAEAILAIVNGGLYHGNDGIYHFSNEGVCSWYDFAMQIAKRAHIDNCIIRPCHSNEFPSKVKRPPFSVLDKTKFKRTFGREIPYWTDSLEKCLARIDELSRQ